MYTLFIETAINTFIISGDNTKAFVNTMLATLFIGDFCDADDERTEMCQKWDTDKNVNYHHH